MTTQFTDTHMRRQASVQPYTQVVTFKATEGVFYPVSYILTASGKWHSS